MLGGARSGKSRHAQRLLAGCAEVLYVAPGQVPDDSDSDWAARVAEHRRNRPEGWTTLETDDVPGALETATQPVLVDCLATWLAGVMGAAGAWESADGDTAWHEPVDAEVDATAEGVAVGVGAGGGGEQRGRFRRGPGDTVRRACSGTPWAGSTGRSPT